MAKQTFTTGQVLTAAQMTSLQQTAMGGGSATAKTASYVLVAADAGGTVAMNAAGATTITVNTGLFAAGDTVFIQNLGAGATTITSGTATVNTAGSLILPQYDAGILYFTATGASIFYDYIQAGGASPLTTKGDLYTFSTSDARLGVGANNTVLTSDSAEATGLKWATPSGSAFAGVLVYRGSDYACANATGVVIPFVTERFDTDAYHDNTTNTSRLTVPAGKAGYYWIAFAVTFAANTTGDRLASIVKNGSTYLMTAGVGATNGARVCTVYAQTILNLSVADYVYVEAFQSSGGSLNATSNDDSTYISMYYLGA